MILRQRALRAGRNIEPLQLVTADDIGRVISEFFDNRPIVEKSEPEEISSMVTADLFASAFGFKQSQNQYQEQKKEEENRVEEIEDEENEKFEIEAHWRKKNWSDGCERTRRWTTGTEKPLKTNWSGSNV